jgi:hypothetical protein
MAGKEFAVEDVTKALVDRYGIEDELALTDARKWVDSLKECGVIE